MREKNRIRRRFELSLDGKQVASIVVGALVVLGAVFVLGLSVGRQLSARPAPPPRAENPLAALDRPPPPAPPREMEPKLSAHEVLTKGQEAPIAEPPPVRPEPGAPATGTALNSLPPPEKPAAPPPERPAPRDQPPPKKAAAKAPAAAQAPRPRGDAVAAAVARVSGKPEGGGERRWSVQVAATQSQAEAQRLQKKHAADGARIAVAEVPGKGTWYRVRVGAYASREEAEKRKASLAQKGVTGFVASGD